MVNKVLTKILPFLPHIFFLFKYPIKKSPPIKCSMCFEREIIWGRVSMPNILMPKNCGY